MVVAWCAESPTDGRHSRVVGQVPQHLCASVSTAMKWVQLQLVFMGTLRGKRKIGHMKCLVNDNVGLGSLHLSAVPMDRRPDTCRGVGELECRLGTPSSTTVPLLCKGLVLI